MSYYIRTWHKGNEGLYKKSGGEYSVLASLFRGQWKLAGYRICDMTNIDELRDITEEEAAMILFQCKGPA